MCVTPLGRPTTYLFDMDRIVGNHLYHPVSVRLNGNPEIVRGKIAGALHLNGNAQYADFGAQAQSCMGNLDLCPNGMLWASWFRPDSLTNNMEVMSGGVNGINMYYNNNMLSVVARTTSRVWQLDVPGLQADAWYFLEVDWHPERGLTVYGNNQLAGSTSRYTERPQTDISNTVSGQDRFYIGRGDGRQQGRRYADVTLDDMEYWYGNRDYLLAFDYIQRGRPDHLLIDMDRLRNNKIVHPSLQLPVYGGGRLVPGQINNALRLNGNGQYLDVGQHSDACLGNLARCRHGMTGSFWANFAEMNNNDYYYSNGDGIRIYHDNGRVHFVFDVENKRWEVEVPYVAENTWQFVEYTWSPRKGLRVYVNNVLQGSDESSERIPEGAMNDRNRVLIGRSNPGDDVVVRYGDFAIDEFETWYGHRDYLIAWDYINRGKFCSLCYYFYVFVRVL